MSHVTSAWRQPPTFQPPAANNHNHNQFQLPAQNKHVAPSAPPPWAAPAPVWTPQVPTWAPKPAATPVDNLFGAFTPFLPATEVTNRIVQSNGFNPNLPPTTFQNLGLKEHEASAAVKYLGGANASNPANPNPTVHAGTLNSWLTQQSGNGWLSSNDVTGALKLAGNMANTFNRGPLDLGGFEKLLKDADFEPANRFSTQELFANTDKDGNGKISPFEKFMAGVPIAHNGDFKLTELKAAMTEQQQNGNLFVRAPDGFLGPDQFKELAQHAGVNELSPFQLGKSFANLASTNVRDGVIDPFELSQRGLSLASNGQFSMANFKNVVQQAVFG